MSKAVEKAYKTYPLTEDNRFNHERNAKRLGFQQGYEQAEKDNELTWGDIREIYCITLNLREHLGASVFGEPLYQEILKRYKETKK